MSGHGEREPAAELGLLDATTIGMWATIGAGIVVLTRLAAERAVPGPSSSPVGSTSSRR